MSLDNLDGQITPNDLIDLGIATRDSNGRLSSGGSISASEQPNTKVYIDLTTGDVVIETNSIERARIAEDGTITGLAAADEVPTLSELVAGTFSTLNVATMSQPVFIAPFPCKIVQASVSAQQGSVASSDTDYLTVEIRKFHGGGTGLIIASKTTKTTGGEAITQHKDWNFDAVTFDATNQLCAKGDLIDFAFLATGSPTAINQPLCQIRYEPV